MGEDGKGREDRGGENGKWEEIMRDDGKGLIRKWGEGDDVMTREETR